MRHCPKFFVEHADDVNNNLVHVDSVPTGAKCNCFCTYCHKPLIAKNKGTKRRHHFAHAIGCDCKKAYETTLHKLAKQILLQTPYIVLPPAPEKNWPSGLTRIKNIETEKFDENLGIIPDAECILDGGERLLIEFRVFHKVDENKRDIILKNNLKCVEFDLRNIFNTYRPLEKILYEYLIQSAEDRKWIVKSELQTTGKSNYYVKNPLYENICNYLKEIFDNGTLKICPFENNYFSPNKNTYFDLRMLRYTSCERDKQIGLLHSNLLFSRDLENDKNMISINVRGRKRSEDFKYPEGLRVIDIIIRNNAKEEDLKQLLESGEIRSSNTLKIEYVGFKENGVTKKEARPDFDIFKSKYLEGFKPEFKDLP